MVLTSVYQQKFPLRQLVLKTDVTLVHTLPLIILDVFVLFFVVVVFFFVFFLFFLPGNLSLVICTCILMQ